MLQGLLDAGGCQYAPAFPPTLADQESRPGDQRFSTVTARRPVMEQVLGGVAEREPALRIRRELTVASVLVEPAGTHPHVSGVQLDTGETITADLVVDAMGRRSRLPRWLEEAGVGPIEEEAEDSGFIYYGRYFGSTDGSVPPLYAPPLCPIGSFSILSLPADNGTWAVGLRDRHGRQTAQGAASHRPGGRPCCARARPMPTCSTASRSAKILAHGRTHRPVSQALTQRPAARYRRRAAGRRVLVHQPVTRTRHLNGAGCTHAHCAAPSPRWTATRSHSPRRGTSQTRSTHAWVPRDARRGPRPTR